MPPQFPKTPKNPGIWVINLKQVITIAHILPDPRGLGGLGGFGGSSSGPQNPQIAQIAQIAQNPWETNDKTY